MDPYMQPLYDNLTVIKHKFSHQSPEFMRINEMIKEYQRLQHIELSVPIIDNIDQQLVNDYECYVEALTELLNWMEDK